MKHILSTIREWVYPKKVSIHDPMMSEQIGLVNRRAAILALMRVK